MRISSGTLHKSTALLAALLFLASASWAKTTSKHPKTSTTHSKHSSSKKSKKSTKRARGQRNIDEQRARQIQSALVREHFLDGEPNGNWDQRTRDAMQKYQAANGWQTKVVPDSRALIKLGLGPSRENVINPETAATSSLAPAVQSAPSGAGGPQAFRQ